MSDISGKSFIARISSVTEDFSGPLNISSYVEIAKSGWLLRGRGEQRAVALRFNYLRHDAERHHYSISSAEQGHYYGAELGVSQNGYLGFYHVASVTDFWKVELTGEGSVEAGFHFVLRDHRGHRVAAHSIDELFGNLANTHAGSAKTFDYLSVQHGEILELRADAVKLL